MPSQRIQVLLLPATMVLSLVTGGLSYSAYHRFYVQQDPAQSFVQQASDLQSLRPSNGAATCVNRPRPQQVSVQLPPGMPLLRRSAGERTAQDLSSSRTGKNLAGGRRGQKVSGARPGQDISGPILLSPAQQDRLGLEAPSPSASVVQTIHFAIHVQVQVRSRSTRL